MGIRDLNQDTQQYEFYVYINNIATLISPDDNLIIKKIFNA